ncbi:multidrug efflux MFS transporter periplasmic adaptor subunit EmrA [Arsenophonus endosymbiont of Bemisia tabaci]|uniref:multidrug efflux MFS transporter periplasmic adaptor subunit EmrA n=1 Tax=Arsenophonus endosymbiont of Bemisia tabaci TaxID=536059 RepID=UPI0015F671AA|nr:multidrug efflux MFS transporter periplasmic adaptor subunit EmrA [Arsenophonus endosymbiont of Bemisia tabaci]CAA2930746.1 Multidrug export protein EmrA [Arsenophonus endosymbiont of Bemisia tabaci Q2]
MGVNEQQLTATKTQKRRTIIVLVSIFFIIIALICRIYWFLVLRHHQSTDNAYIAANQIQIMSQVPGSVITVNVENTDFVKSGTVLVKLDPRDAILELEKAKTNLANSVRQTHQHMINSRQYQANISLRRSELNKLQQDLQRREILGQSKVIAKEELQHAREAVIRAKAALDVAVEQFNANQAIVLDTPLDKQPTVLQAATELRNAWLTLERTQIVTPVDGYVSRRSVQVGARITPATPLMAVVPTDNMWIDANFKETQLADIRIGQPAKITTDFYGKNIIYQGRVEGLDMGTGSTFSLLPAQNASGNWIKIVQRLPVRVTIDKEQLKKYPLRIGLSSDVTVDTSDKNGPILSRKTRYNPAYHTNAFKINMAPVDRLVTDIIDNNSGSK